MKLDTDLYDESHPQRTGNSGSFMTAEVTQVGKN
jgi:hypothetical protein